MSQQSYERAVADFTRATELMPAFAVALYNRSLVYTLLGMRDLSAQDRARAVRLDPTVAKSTR